MPVLSKIKRNRPHKAPHPGFQPPLSPPKLLRGEGVKCCGTRRNNENEYEDKNENEYENENSGVLFRQRSATKETLS